MLWYNVALVAMSVFAGAGAKWLVDRTLGDAGQQLRLSTKSLQLIVGLLQEYETRPRHTYTAANTMDVLADGVEAGKHAARRERLRFGTDGGASPDPGWGELPLSRPADYPYQEVADDAAAFHGNGLS